MKHQLDEKKKAACEALKAVADKIKELIEKTPFQIKLGNQLNQEIIFRGTKTFVAKEH
jgi:hypothetical protein